MWPICESQTIIQNGRPYLTKYCCTLSVKTKSYLPIYSNHIYPFILFFDHLYLVHVSGESVDDSAQRSGVEEADGRSQYSSDETGMQNTGCHHTAQVQWQSRTGHA